MTDDGLQASGQNNTDVVAERPGDPPCWQCRVCPDCGTIADYDPPTTCQQCGAEIVA